MAEVTHNQIIERVSAVENSQSEMRISLALVNQSTERAIKGVEKNRDHFDEQLGKLTEAQHATYTELAAHRSEVKTGVKVLVGVFTAGMTVLGLLIAA